MTNKFDWKLDLEITLKKGCEPLLATQDNKGMLRDELIRMEEEMIELIKQQIHRASSLSNIRFTVQVGRC